MNREIFKRACALTAAVAVSAALAACGDDDTEPAETAATTTTPTTAETTTDTATETTTTDTTTTTTESETAGDVPDQAETEAIVLGYLIDGDCETMSEEFLQSQVFGDDDDSRADLCEQWDTLFTEPQYTAEDIIFSDYEVAGDEVKITIGDDFSGIESIYTFVNEDGVWRILSADIQ